MTQWAGAGQYRVGPHHTLPGQSSAACRSARRQIGELMGKMRDFDQMVPGESVQALTTEKPPSSTASSS
ncbi:hypothetical protein [Streptomyces sp. NPDC060366]|uniref:hypothetical protein n=1 Tax=Streptomyces sp. NPDC060366 TaxID=3347105 RepID=UPI003657A7DA